MSRGRWSSSNTSPAETGRADAGALEQHRLANAREGVLATSCCRRTPPLYHVAGKSLYRPRLRSKLLTAPADAPVCSRYRPANSSVKRARIEREDALDEGPRLIVASLRQLAVRQLNGRVVVAAVDGRLRQGLTEISASTACTAIPSRNSSLVARIVKRPLQASAAFFPLALLVELLARSSRHSACASRRVHVEVRGLQGLRRAAHTASAPETQTISKKTAAEHCASFRGFGDTFTCFARSRVPPCSKRYRVSRFSNADCSLRSEDCVILVRQDRVDCNLSRKRDGHATTTLPRAPLTPRNRDRLLDWTASLSRSRRSISWVGQPSPRSRARSWTSSVAGSPTLRRSLAGYNVQ